MEKTRVVCPKCRGFLAEVSPYLSNMQELKAYCRKCNSFVIGVPQKCK